MDINEAALRLKKIEIIEDQIKHLQAEARAADDIVYSEDCNAKAQELCQTLKEFWL